MRLISVFFANSKRDPERCRDRVASLDVACGNDSPAVIWHLFLGFHWGLRVLRKIEALVREEQNRAGAVELLMPYHSIR